MRNGQNLFNTKCFISKINVMLKKSIQIMLVLFILLSVQTYATQSDSYTDSLYVSINTKGINTSQKLDILYEIIYHHYLSNHYDEMKLVIDEANKLLESNKNPCLNNKFMLMEARHALAVKNKSLATSLANKVLSSSQKNECAEIEISTLLFQAVLLLRHEDADTCINKIMLARRLAISLGDKVLIARSHDIEGIYKLVKNNFNESRKLFLLAIKIFEEFEEHTKTSRAYYNIAYSYYLQSAYDSALIYNKMAIPFLERSRSDGLLVSAYNNIALIYQNQGKLNEAIETYFKGLKVADRMNSIKDRILILYNLGNCYYSLDAKDKAKDNFYFCLQQSEIYKDTFSIIYACNAIGNMALEDEEIDTAFKYIHKSYQLANIIDDHYSLMFGSTSLAALQIEKMNFDAAQKLLNISYDYAKESNNPDDFININIVQAELYAKQKNYKKSIALLKETYKNALSTNSQESARFVLMTLEEVYEESGDFGNALLYSKKVKNYQDSINSVSILANLVNVESQYEQEKVEEIRRLESKNAELERLSELRNTRFVAIIAIISAITLVIISFLFYSLSRSRKKRNSDLKEKNILIETHSEDLEKLVNKLQKITKDLDSSNKTKSKLLSIIGHDLRNPFNVIQGYISILTDDEIDSTERRLYYDRINNSSDQLMEMVENLLVWSNTQSKKISPKPLQTDITEIANNSIAVIQNNANLKNIQIIADYDKSNKTVILVDPEMLTRIVHNLLVNAIKFTNNEGKVYLGFKQENSKMKFWVKDTGIGMNPDDAAAIFEISTDFVKSGTAGEKGTGLGLSICHDFVKYHDGTIWAESEIGVGSSFIFELPIK